MTKHKKTQQNQNTNNDDDMKSIMIFLFFVNLILCPQYLLVQGFTNSLRNRRSSMYQIDEYRLQVRNFEEDDSITDDPTRRKFLEASFASSVILYAPNALAQESNIENFDCLTDLPALNPDNVRLYLCRHGQTENNRLRKVQGARIDPPINYNGIVQAKNLGKSLARANPKPHTFFCSDLTRAKNTAELASSEIDSRIKPKELDLLREVDFGPVAEGQPIALAKAGMQATYAAWAIGNIDYRPSGGGETGRQVLERAAESLKFLAKEAEASGDTVAAVTHSTFLRILIGMVLNEPLVESASRKIENCSVTVIDIPKSMKTVPLESNPRLLGGGLSQAPSDFVLDVPYCDIIRINESRHLPIIPTGEILSR